MGLKKYQQFGLIIIVSAAVWLTLFNEAFGLKLSPPLREVLVAFPLYSLVVLGCHALASIGLGLVRFNNCPEAATELEQDVRDAKKDLEKKGIKVDLS